MSERDKEIADLAKRLMGNILEGALAGGKMIDSNAAAQLAVKSATALVDTLTDPKSTLV